MSLPRLPSYLPVTTLLRTLASCTLACCTLAAQAQTTPDPVPAAPAAQTAQPTAKAAAHHRKAKRAVPASPRITSIPLESAPPTPASATATQQARQRAADQRLLAQQQTQSDKAAQINDQQVRTAVQQQNKVQSEPRIQDAPGPSQTGAVPSAGAPAQPATPDTRIQDAPGPAQTPPPQPPAAPSTPPQ